jgi:O6-methylguanine-DNA--protein-cysteine methyltransferase
MTDPTTPESVVATIEKEAIQVEQKVTETVADVAAKAVQLAKVALAKAEEEARQVKLALEKAAEETEATLKEHLAVAKKAAEDEIAKLNFLNKIEAIGNQVVQEAKKDVGLVEKDADEVIGVALKHNTLAIVISLAIGAAIATVTMLLLR